MDAGEPTSVCDVSDACDELRIDAARSGVLAPLWPGCPSVSGLLTTIRLEPANAAPSPLPEVLDVLAAARGRVALIDLGGRTDQQYWGSVLATAAVRYGIAGALVNGAARDVDELRELAFPTYARGVHPAAARGRLRFCAANEPVDLDGALVEPDSFAVVDSSGAVFLPAGRREDVLELARRRKAEEWDLRRAVTDGADPKTVFSPLP